MLIHFFGLGFIKCDRLAADLKRVDFPLHEPCILVLGVWLVKGLKLKKFFLKTTKYDLLKEIVHFCISSSSHYHLSRNREGRWGTTDDFRNHFRHFSLFSTALWDLPNSRPAHSLMLSSHLSLCLPCLLPPFTVPCKMVLARPDERET